MQSKKSCSRGASKRRPSGQVKTASTGLAGKRSYTEVHGEDTEDNEKTDCPASRDCG